MKKNKLFRLLLMVYGCVLSAQGADNALHGYYGADNDKTLYSSFSFSFDGNGKVLIADMDYGDFFTRNDSLIIYPDKSIFIFKIKKDKLIGISNWVEKGVWSPRKDSTSINNRLNPIDAKKKAELLAEYYDKTKKSSKSGLDFDALVSGKTNEINEKLCQKGLAKACMNLFGLKMMEYTPDLLSDPGKIPSKKLKAHPELILLSERIIELGEPEGYTVLGSYYYVLGLKEKAFKTWDEGEKKGSLKSARTKAMVEIQEELNQEDQKK
ncbi:hypothetical protein [Chryseobacterium sp. SIMBA_029]|uniref:hypothetical protein n=1 Tax=Chryseobacterium sp. SIMBA_029 TaxID=3085772 RepID=UPI00397847D3